MLMTEEEKTTYAEKLRGMTDDELIEQVYENVLAAGYISRMSVADEKATLCYREAVTVRNQTWIYQRGYNKAANAAGMEVTYDERQKAQKPESQTT